MSAWPGKYVIGLTGNIATGKSVVRKMLEHLGAYGIDADALAHRAIAQGAPGYQPLINTFGKWILAPDGQIDRAKLGRVVFNDPEGMAQLEAIVHPLVVQAVDILIRRSGQRVVVLEAIKLIESGLANKCDALWITYAPYDTQLSRLMNKRGMTETAARQRINAQTPQEKRFALAGVVIRNESSFEDTWQQVYTAWQRTFPSAEVETEAEALQPSRAVAGEWTVYRARPREAGDIAGLITQMSQGKRRATREDIMAAFGEKAFLLLRVDGRVMGLVGWKVENLVARTDDVFIDSNIAMVDALRVLLNELERVSRELQCEISLLFLPPEYHSQEVVLRALGYQRRTVQNLGVSAWEEAAIESMPAGSLMYFKQLRQDRVLRPV
ncbi:MAG: dephospho-CoA kinase [Anaerolineales bacterium]|nr:dephospho-CoA kinase [Anaerolineales bacterium]